MTREFTQISIPCAIALPFNPMSIAIARGRKKDTLRPAITTAFSGKVGTAPCGRFTWHLPSC
jgi:hypothetical protein